MPPKKKQTARKTTGKHLLLSSASSSSSSRRRSQLKRVQHPLAPASGSTGSRSQTTSLKSILKRPSATTSSSASLPVVSGPSIDSRFDVIQALLSTSASGTEPASRPAVEALDTSISVCTRFATWLESQQYVQVDELVRAVERDGSSFLSLAKATVMFDNALRGQVQVPPAVNGVASPLGEHARTLRVFAELLKSKISEGSLSNELETAVLRDGETFLRLASCCLEFDEAVSGSGGTVGS